MRDRRRIWFWEDKWCGLEPLGAAFPSLYAVTDSKGATMADFWDHSLEFWNPRFLRAFNNWKLEQICSLLSSLHGKRISAEEKDTLIWTASKGGTFTVKSLMGFGEGQFPRKMVWNSCIPTKISFFAWEIWWG